MNIGVLNNVVDKIILPKNPWIKDFIWSSFKTGPYRYHSLELTVDKDFFLEDIDRTELRSKLYDDVKMLFKMVGPEENDFFDDVEIIADKK